MEHKLFRKIISIGYCYHVSAGAFVCYLNILEKIQKQVHCATSPTLAYSLSLQKKHCNVISIGLFYI